MALPIRVAATCTEAEAQALQAKLLDTLLLAGMEQKRADGLPASLLERYREPHRKYHNLSHIGSLLAMAELPAFKWQAKHLVHLAIWFHDAVYDPAQKDNEARSAQLARASLSCCLAADELAFIENAILSTTAHQPLQEEGDLLQFLDLDLSVLAAPADIYQEYSRAIRLEYKRYPWLLYREGRKKVLRAFLNRPRLFFSQPFSSDHEKAAQKNLADELAQLHRLFS